MQVDYSESGDHVTIVVKKPGLPDDEQHRETLLEELESAVETTLSDHELNADLMKVIGGHTYTSISSICPKCNEHVNLVEPELGPNNGAYARASCTCGWHGTATYRLIDFETAESERPDNNEFDDEDTPSILETSSSVRLYDVLPTYTPY